MRENSMHRKHPTSYRIVAVRPAPVGERNLVEGGCPRVRKAIWIVALVALLVAGFASTLFSIYSAEHLINTKQAATLSIRGDALDASATKQVLDTAARIKDAPSFALWEERSSEHVQNTVLGRSAQVSAVLVYGSVDLVVKGAFLPVEDLPTSTGSPSSTTPEAFSSPMAATGACSEQKICVIDTATSLELFGDSDVVGMSIRFGSEDFLVGSVVDCARPLFIIRPTDQTGVAFDMLTARNTSGQGSSSVGQQLSVSFGLDAEIVDYELLYTLAYLLAWLPTILLAGGYLVFLLTQGFAKGNSPRQQTLYLIGFLFSSIVLIAFIALNMQLPRDMIPSRFSDFFLWQQILDDKTSALEYLFDSPIYAPAAQVYDSFFTAGALSVVSLVLYLGAIWLLTCTHSIAPAPQPRQQQRRALHGPGISAAVPLPSADAPRYNTCHLPLSRYNWKRHTQGRQP